MRSGVVGQRGRDPPVPVRRECAQRPTVTCGRYARRSTGDAHRPAGVRRRPRPARPAPRRRRRRRPRAPAGRPWPGTCRRRPAAGARPPRPARRRARRSAPAPGDSGTSPKKASVTCCSVPADPARRARPVPQPAQRAVEVVQRGPRRHHRREQPVVQGVSCRLARAEPQPGVAQVALHPHPLQVAVHAERQLGQRAAARPAPARPCPARRRTPAAGRACGPGTPPAARPASRSTAGTGRR